MQWKALHDLAVEIELWSTVVVNLTGIIAGASLALTRAFSRIPISWEVAIRMALSSICFVLAGGAAWLIVVAVVIEPPPHFDSTVAAVLAVSATTTIVFGWAAYRFFTRLRSDLTTSRKISN